jgi:hypothetical protein
MKVQKRMPMRMDALTSFIINSTISAPVKMPAGGEAQRGHLRHKHIGVTCVLVTDRVKLQFELQATTPSGCLFSFPELHSLHAHKDGK